MKKSLILVLLLFISPISTINELFSQEADSIWYKRDRYFFIQRGSPYDSVPTNALYDALTEKSGMSPNGYHLQNLAWYNIGPAPYDVGSGNNSRYNSGRVNTIKYLSSGVIYIGGAQGGVWKSTSFSTSGATWQNMSADLKSLSSGALAVDNSDPQNPVIYYATGEGNHGFLYTYFGMGIFKSSDGGSSWTQIYVGSGLPSRNVKYFRLVIRPGVNSHIFAVTNYGVYRSANSGVNWSVVSGTQNLECNDLVFSNSNNNNAFVVGPSWGIGYKISTDGGENFVTPSGNPGLETAKRTNIAICRDDNQVLYSVTDIGGQVKVFKSEDGGATFDEKEIIDVDTYLGYCLCIAVKPSDADVVFVGAAGLVMSSNGGDNFCKIAGFFTSSELGYCIPGGDWMHADFHGIDFNPSNDDEMVIATDGGPYLSTDGGIYWYSLNNDDGFSITQLYRISRGSILIGGAQDIGFLRRQNAQNDLMWLKAIGESGDGTGVVFSKHDASIWFGFFGHGPFFKSGELISQNFGNVWDGGNDWIGALTEDPVNAGRFYTARRNDNGEEVEINFWKTTNYGNNWNAAVVVASGFSPQNIEVSTKNPQIVYLSTSGYVGNNFGRELYKSTNAGTVSWIEIISKTSSVIPNRYITRILTNPAVNAEYEDEIYLTLSSFNTPNYDGHVFKSTNGGVNWDDLTGNLPNIPVNDIVVWYSGNCGALIKNLIVATDIGVFVSTNEGTSWQEFAADLPNTVIMDLEYLKLENKLQCATFGRGVWQVDLPGNIYIKGTVYTSGNVNLNSDLIICSGGKLKMSNGQVIEIATDKKIIIEDGGELELTSGTVTFIGSGWDGIEINDNAVWDVHSCSIFSTATPIIVQGSGQGNYDNIALSNITFDNVGPVQVINRSNVSVHGCNFKQGCANQDFPEVCAVISSGSNNIDIKNNEIEAYWGLYNPCIIPSTAISINYGSNISIEYNTITNISNGISISNSSPYINENIINAIGDLEADIGIILDNSGAAVLNENTITNCILGVMLFNSSPTMLKNVISVSNIGLDANYNSSPRLRPDYAPGQVIWDAGQNDIQTSDIGIYLYDYSLPDVDYGFNTINGTNYYITGAYYGNNSGYAFDYYVRCNDWVDNPVNGSKFALDLNIIYQSNDCEGPGGGGGGGGGSFPNYEGENANNELLVDPQPLIVNYGNGVYDTIHTSFQSNEFPADRLLYFQAMEQELLSNFNSAFTIYQTVVQNYQDSLSAINSLKRLIRCKDRLNADTSAYSQLRAYYQSLVSNNPTDTVFVKVAGELASKCLVRMGQHPSAITEYESIVSSSSDTLEVLNAELNIIGIYMLMSEGGDAPTFTGNYAQLKPMNLMEGFRMIKQKLHGTSSNSSNIVVPLQYSLSQNYPNPFNPVTRINYALPKSTKVNLIVYDILGREVKRLINNEFKEAGRYTVEFNGRNLASGVYFYRIEAGDFVQSKKMVLVK